MQYLVAKAESGVLCSLGSSVKSREQPIAGVSNSLPVKALNRKSYSIGKPGGSSRKPLLRSPIKAPGRVQIKDVPVTSHPSIKVTPKEVRKSDENLSDKDSGVLSNSSHVSDNAKDKRGLTSISVKDEDETDYDSNDELLSGKV